MPSLTNEYPRGTRSDLGLAALWFATCDLNDGVRENLGRNDGTRIRQYASAFELTPPINWCSVSVSAWVRKGALLSDILSPIDGSPAARGIEAQFIEAGLWVPKDKLNPDVLVPGNIPVWWRGKDIDDWPGHIGVIDACLGMSMNVIEANSGKYGDEVAKMSRSILDHKLLGVGVLRGQLVRHEFHEPTDYELERAAELIRLQRELLLQGEPDDPLADLNARLEREGFDDGSGE
jgi:hypothetical protein